MLLKCRYLAQFSVSELAKNGSKLSQAEAQCPFLSHARRTLATGVNLETENQQEQEQQNKSIIASQDLNTKTEKEQFISKCTFNIPVIERKFDDLAENQKKNDQKNVLNDRNQFVASEKLESKVEDNRFDYADFFDERINAKKKDGSYRYFKKIIRNAAEFPVVQEKHQKKKRDVAIWCSNDYLGLGTHPYVTSKVCDAVKEYGVGSGGTRNISGSNPIHEELESELAKLHQKEAGLVFTSCYVANDTTLYTMAKMLPNCHILSDAGNHASMIQGIRNSGVPRTIFRHNDYDHLEECLKKLPIHIPKIVAFESVHSMDGSICDLEKMCDISHKYGGITFIDEVHAVGLYGKNGGGIGERDDVLDKMDIITGTLGKALGNIGGYIVGKSTLVDSMRSYGSGFIFTTSLPPSVAAGSLASLEISRSDEGRELRARHQLYAQIVKDELNRAGLPLYDTPSHIVPVMVGNTKHAYEICDRLLNDYAIYIQAINYPTVARGTERLRIVPNPHHTPDMIEKLIFSLIEVWKKTGLSFKL